MTFPYAGTAQATLVCARCAARRHATGNAVRRVGGDRRHIHVDHAVVTGYPSDATENAVQADIVTAGHR